MPKPKPKSKPTSGATTERRKTTKATTTKPKVVWAEEEEDGMEDEINDDDADEHAQPLTGADLIGCNIEVYWGGDDGAPFHSNTELGLACEPPSYSSTPRAQRGMPASSPRFAPTIARHHHIQTSTNTSSSTTTTATTITTSATVGTNSTTRLRSGSSTPRSPPRT